jgi:RNA polymerase sigma-70 factor (ECF subfamily)
VSSKPTPASVQKAVSPSTSGRLNVADVVREQQDSLRRFLRRRLSRPEDVEDVAQEAYIRLLHYDGSPDVRSSSALLRRIATNTANDRARAERVRHATDHVSVEGLELPDHQPDVLRELEAQQNFARLCDVVERLPSKCQQVFLLSRVHGFTYLEIARHCGISVKMVEKHISRALARCLSAVGEDALGTS